MKKLIVLFVLSLTVAVEAASLEQARKLYQEKKYEDSFDEYAELIFEQPMASARIHYEQGLAALKMKNPAQAAACLERAVTLNPAFLDARVLLAKCYTDMNLQDAAKDQLNRILAGPVPREVRDTVGRYLSFVEDSERRWRISGLLEISAFYDSNVNYGPLHDRITTPMGTMRLEDMDETDSCGVGLGFSGDFSYRLSEQANGWYTFANLQGYQSILENNADDFNLLAFRTRAGLRHLEQDSLLEVNGAYNYIGQGDHSLLNGYGVDVGGAILQSDRICHSLYGHYEYRDYLRSFAERGNYVALDYSIRYALDENAKSSVRLLLRAFNNDTDRKAMDNYGTEVHLLAETALPWGLQIYGGGGWRYSKYGDILYPIIQDDKREDNEAIALIGIRKRLPMNLQADLSYRHSRTYSSFDLFEYDRDIVTLVLSKRF